ncbi:hypothetical protein GW846_04470 [Candidatus Gracilibacteria bacterium]|nr:hypothetical protein [Candidatus Gracilibacteria bacterium]
MFTLIQNYRTLFMMCINASLEMGNLRAADTNEDGMLTGDEFNKLTDAQKLRVQNDLGEENLKRFSEAGRIIFEQKEKAQAIVTQSASTAHNENSRNIEQSTGALSPNKVPSAVNYYSSGRCSQENVNNLVQVMKNKGLNYDGSWESFAQNIASLQMSLGFTGNDVDGKAGPGTITALNAQSTAQKEEATQVQANDNLPLDATNLRGQEASSEAVNVQFGRTLKRGMSGDDVVVLQNLLTNMGYDTNGIDGSFGPGTEGALKKYQQEKLGQSGDGRMDMNGATMKSFMTTKSSVSNTNETQSQSRNVFQKLGDFFKRGGEVPTNLSGIDKFIDARNTELNAIGEQITNAKQSRNPQAIAQAHTAILVALRNKVPVELYNTIAQARSPIEQTRVLDFISNALMGGRNTVEIAQGRESARKYSEELNRLQTRTGDVLRNEGLSSSFIQQSLATIDAVEQRIKAGTQFSAGYKSFDSAFSVRTKGNNNQLEGFSKGSIEALTIDGVNAWDIQETMSDKLKFIDNMNLAQIKDIDNQLRYINGLTVESLKELVQKGQVEMNVIMFIAHNCGNVSFATVIKDNTPAPQRPKDNDGGTPNKPNKPDKPTTEPTTDPAPTPNKPNKPGKPEKPNRPNKPDKPTTEPTTDPVDGKGDTSTTPTTDSAGGSNSGNGAPETAGDRGVDQESETSTGDRGIPG